MLDIIYSYIDLNRYSFRLYVILSFINFNARNFGSFTFSLNRRSLNFDFVAISETWVKENYPHYELPDYIFII